MMLAQILSLVGVAAGAGAFLTAQATTNRKARQDWERKFHGHVLSKAERKARRV